MMDQPLDQEQEKKMSFIGHLEELRWRLVKISAAIVVGAIVAFIFTEPLIDTLYVSMSKTSFPTYKFFCETGHMLGLGDSLCAEEIKLSLVSTEMMGQFSVNLFFAIVFGIVITSPFIFWQIWSFIKPALRERELKASKGFVFFTTFLFLIGSAFGYLLVAPLSVQFFGNWMVSEEVSNLPTINSYMRLITSTTLLSGLLFELPMLVLILSKIGIITPDFLKRYRKHAIVVVLILSAIITPPDFFSQVIVALPVMLLYEISIIIAARNQKRSAVNNN